MLHKTYLHTPKTIRKKKLQIISRILIFTIAIFYPISQTFATIDKDTLNFYSKNNILFYDPTGRNSQNCDYYSTITPHGSEITWIGDSYSVGAKDIIMEKFPDVDFGTSINDKNSYIQVSKFVSSSSSNNPSGLTILESLISTNTIRKYVVFALGTNGGWEQSYINKILDIIPEETKVILVTSKTATTYDYSTSNQILKKATEENPDKIYLADWTEVYQDSFYTSDPEHIHPTANGGYDEWVDLIYKTLSKTGETTSKLSASPSGTNSDYNGDQVFSDAQLQAIEANKPFYVSAAESYGNGMPWQILAVIHNRESGLARQNNTNGQGVYQFYAQSERNECKKLNGASFTAGPLSDSEFQKHTDCAANFLVKNYGSNLDMTNWNNDDTVKKLFFYYNSGAAAGQPGYTYYEQAIRLGFSAEEAARGEGSPYVMNKADTIRDPNKNKTTWGQIKQDGGGLEYPANQDHGAFIQYAALGGSSGVTNCTLNNTLIEGGMTFEQAEKYMESYKKIAATNDKKMIQEYGINQTNCWGGSFYNCVAFDQYFIATSTLSKAPPLGNGKTVVDTLVDLGIATRGDAPQPYSIFSTNQYSSYGHTGVVLGVTESEIIIGEAGCFSGPDGIKARTISMEEATSELYWYAYLNNLKGQ